MAEATQTASETAAAAVAGGAPPEAVPAAPAPDAPVEAKPTPDAPETAAKPTADAWAKIRQAEDRARREREEAKAEAKRTAEQRAEIDRLRAEVDEQRKRLSLEAFGGDPSAFLEAHGIDYDDLTRRMLSKPTKAAKPSKEIEELRAELAEIKKASEADKAQRKEAAESAAWSQVFGAFETEIAPPAEGDHAYELVHHEYQADPDYIRDTLREMAKLAPELTVAQAAARLEEYLLGQTKSRLALRKVRGLISPSGESQPSSKQAQQATKTGQEASGGGPRTLSHQDSSERATEIAPPKPLHEMTLYERRQWEKDSEARAAAALEAQGWGSRSA